MRTGPGRAAPATTSPNGTTAAGLAVLMDDDAGLTPLMVRTVAAATEAAGGSWAADDHL